MMSASAAMRWFPVLLLVASTASWGGQDKASSNTNPGPQADPIQVSGHERLTWDQAAASTFEAERLSFVAYVDGEPTGLEDVICNTRSGAIAFVCSSQLPEMTPGTHTIQLASYFFGTNRLANPRSSSIQIRFTPPPTAGAVAAFANASFSTMDGVRLHKEVLATGLDDVTDLVALPDGRVLLAERAGRIRVFRDGALVATPAIALPDATTAGGGGLLALAADREFEKTRAIYALYTTDSGLRLARFFESNNTLSNRAILLEGLAISRSQPTARLRMGPDGKLYVAIDDGGNANNLGDLGSVNGKVLRLNKDGTTPDDQTIQAFATGFDRPIGMDWSEDGKTLWMTGADADRAERLQSFVLDPRTRRGAAAKRYALPPDAGTPSLVLYANQAIPAFRGNIFVAVEASRSLLRLRLDSSGGITETEWLFRGQFDSIRVIGAAPDGSLYIGTSGTLVRIVPEG